MESFERLQALHADLVSHAAQSFNDLDRLRQGLHESISDFKILLDNVEIPAADRERYRKGELVVEGQGFAINEEFRNLSSAIGVALDAPEEYAGRLITESQIPISEDIQPLINDVVRMYHERRDVLLQDLRMILQQVQVVELEQPFREVYNQCLNEIVGQQNNGKTFTQKCLNAMVKIEARQLQLNDQIQSKAILGQARGEEFYRTLEFQRSSLFKQHEALGAIVALLFNSGRSYPEDLRKLHELSLKWQRLDFQWVHYLPAFGYAFDIYGTLDSHANNNEARQLNHLFSPTFRDGKFVETENAIYRPLGATLDMWWTARYSSFYRENAAPDNEAVVRDKVMKKALDEGGLEFMLLTCTNMKKDPWLHSTRQELVNLLLDGSNIAFDGVEPTSSFFYLMMMQAYENFAENWITNMPDSIRDLKKEEDDRRLLQITATADGTLQRPTREESLKLHLEAFLVLIAFAFEGRPDEAEQFWEDPDSNLYGFVQWASRRQTVPRVSAFCEMLCAISELDSNAEAAHKFLLEDTIVVPALRNKRMPSMSYQQIFAELEFYSRKVHEKAQINTMVKQRNQPDPEMNELESPVMLSCYLRLLSHLFRQGASTRNYVLAKPADVDLLKSLLTLSSGTIPSYLRANIFIFFEALLTDKSAGASELIWSYIDEWAATTHDRAKTGEKQQAHSSLQSLQNTLSAIASSYDQYDAFVRLLIALVQPVPKDSGLPLPFPPELGTTYRYPGIVPYVDFVCSQLTTKNVDAWHEDNSTTAAIRTSNAFEFMLICLTSFNEAAVVNIGKSSPLLPADENYYISYAQRHPFARTMQWTFSSGMIPALIKLAHQPLDVVAEALFEDPKIVSLTTLINLFNHVIDLQPTYFDALRSKLKSLDGYRTIQFSGVNAIEETVFSSPEILLDLCRYATTEHVQLVLSSLAYLERLSQSAKFQHHLFDDTQRNRSARRMIDLIGITGETQLKHISASLAIHLVVDYRALDLGIECDNYCLKDGILSFLNACLASHSRSTNIAHLLLGFDRLGDRLAFTEDFETGSTMFDSLVALSILFPVGLENHFESWMTHIRAEVLCALNHLWSSPVSADLTLTQLRRADYLSTQFLQEKLISRATLWDGVHIQDQNFFFGLSSEAFTDFLSYRKHLYDYVSYEVSAVGKENILALQERYSSTLQGKSVNAEGISENHATIFDLFDFAEIDLLEDYYLAVPDLKIFGNIDFSPCLKHGMYDMERARLMLEEVTRSITDRYEEARQTLDTDALREESASIISLLQARNRHTLSKVERLACLEAYVKMVTVAIQSLPLEHRAKTQFIMQMLQLIMPKLDMYLTEEASEAVPLTLLADTLLYELSQSVLRNQENEKAKAAAQTQLDIAISERLFQVFRICAEGVPLSIRNPDLRTSLYSICAQYLSHIMSSRADTESTQRACSNAMDTVRSIGPQLVSIVSDDADEGLDTCRTNALSFLSELVSLARNQKSNVLIESFVKSNILETLLDPMKSISEEFQTTEPANRIHLTTLFEARIHLLLQVSRTRAGALALLDANLMQTLRDSLLFAADPDLGLDLNTGDTMALIRSSNPVKQDTIKSGLTTYFTLVAQLLRLLLSTFLSFGAENEKMIYIIRTFLQDYRGNMVGVFKRAAGLNLAAQNTQSFLGSSTLSAGDRETRRYVDECATAYTGLAVGCDFMEFEEERGLAGNGIANPGLGRSVHNGGGFT